MIPPSLFYQSIWDAGGIDTIDISNFSTDCTVNLIPGSYSSIQYINTGTGSDLYDGTNNLGIAFGVTIEIVRGGSGNDVITGNSAGNSLSGGGGNDTLERGQGSDIEVFRGNFNRITASIIQQPEIYTITDKIAGRDGADLITSVENLQISEAIKVGHSCTNGW